MQIFWGFCRNQFGIGPLHFISLRSDFNLDFAEISKNDSPTRRVGESRRLPIDTIVFKPLNKTMMIVHYILVLFLAKLVL
jgi:hypothetical protein